MSGKYRMAQAEGLRSITLSMSLLIEELCRKYHDLIIIIIIIII